jgi:hypothetical protein
VSTSHLPFRAKAYMGRRLPCLACPAIQA